MIDDCECAPMPEKVTVLVDDTPLMLELPTELISPVVNRILAGQSVFLSNSSGGLEVDGAK